MKLIKAYLHHIRAAEVVQALADAGYRNITLFDVMGTGRAVTEQERQYSTDGAGLLVGEVQMELACNDADVGVIVEVIRHHGKIGGNLAGWIYVSPIDGSFPIDGKAA